MRWKIIAGCTAAVLCLCAGLWLAVQQQESASGAANLLHIYSDQQNAGTDSSNTTGGVQPTPPAPHQESDQSSKSSKPSGTQNKPNTGGSDQTSSTSAAPSESESPTTSAAEESSEPETPSTPEATFSIIGSEGGITAPLEEGDTVYSVTEKMMEGYPLPDFDYGEQGRWEYSVNGQASDVPASEYVIQNGDVLEWRPVLPQPSTSTEAPETSTSIVVTPPAPTTSASATEPSP